MIYRDFKGEKLSLLGFGGMRLPLKEDKSIDMEQTAKMIDLAIQSGVNYFDTAYPYHEGKSELVFGEILSRYPRNSYNLATKFPGHELKAEYNPEEIFEEQLRKCRVGYFDYYLLHNVCESSFNVYTDKKWNILPYFVEQKKKGRIRHLGFSTHSRPDHLEMILKEFGSEMEFCQIQLNYLDWTLQDAKEKCNLLKKYGIPVWVMEPIRGGRLANLSGEAADILKGLNPDIKPVEWAFRFVQSNPEVRMILSGMSDYSQMEENIRIFSEEKTLSEKEQSTLQEAAETLKEALPCTACRYCCDGCPMGLDIPLLISAYNDAKFNPVNFTVAMMLDTLPDDKQPEACIGCGQCATMCPQKIDIPKAMQEFGTLKSRLPNWKNICADREEAARKLKNAKE